MVLYLIRKRRRKKHTMEENNQSAFEQYVKLSEETRKTQQVKRKLLGAIEETMVQEHKGVYSEDGSNFFVCGAPKPKKATLDMDFVVLGFQRFFQKKNINIPPNEAQEFRMFLEQRRLQGPVENKKRVRLQKKRPPESYFVD